MPTYAQTILATSGLLGYWRLGEASGTTAADSSPNGRNLTTSGATVAQPGLLAGDANTAYVFDGTNDNTALIEGATLDFATSDALSVEAWIKLDTNLSLDMFFSMQSGAAGATLYRFGTEGSRFPFWNVSGAASRNVGSQIADSTAYHFVFTAGIETGTVHTRLYVNGALDATVDEGIAGLSNADCIVIGSNREGGSGSNWFGGTVDDVALYNVVLTPAQIATHYEIGSTGPTSDGNPYARIRNQFELRPY